MCRLPPLAAMLCLALSAIAQSPQAYPLPRSFSDLFGVRSAEAQQLILPPVAPEDFTLQLRFGGTVHTMQLRPHEIRSPGFQLLVDDGVEIVPVDAPASVTYRGELVGEPDSAVAATYIGGELRASMHSGGKAWTLQPLADVQPGLLPGVHVVYEHAALLQLPSGCGVTGRAPAIPGLETSRAAAEDSSHLIAELAIDADEPYYQHHGGSVFAVHNEILSIINAMDLIFERDVGVAHRITTILVRTVPTYTSTTTASALLNEFRNRWNAFHNDINRDIAHLFSGRPDPGNVVGIAFLGTICLESLAYGVSWTLFDVNNFQRRVGLTSHELGHSWGADHCDGHPTCDIMCSDISSCGPTLSFGSPPIGQMVAFRDSRFCLDADPIATEAPTLATVAPSTVSSFAPGQAILTGDNLDQVTSVTVGGVPATFTTVGKNLLDFTPPTPFDIATHQVVVSNSQGSASIDLDVVGSHPSIIEAPERIVPGVATPIRVHSDREWQGLLVLSLSSLPSEVPGVVSLDLGNNLTQVIPLAVTADTRGVAEVVLTIPVGFPFFVEIFWQAVMFADPANLTLPLETSERVSVFTWFF